MAFGGKLLNFFLLSFRDHWDLMSYNKSVPFKISWLSENISCVIWRKAGHNPYSYIVDSKRGLKMDMAKENSQLNHLALKLNSSEYVPQTVAENV